MLGPESITDLHVTEHFDCGKPTLNAWLRQRALSNHRAGFTSVHVVHRDLKVLGYHGLAPTAVAPVVFPRNIRTGQPPEKIPCVLLARLAVDLTVKGKGVGALLLRHALQSALYAADFIGGRALLVEALDDDALSFWESRGFQFSRDNRYMLFMPMAMVRATLQEFNRLDES